MCITEPKLSPRWQPPPCSARGSCPWQPPAHAVNLLLFAMGRLNTGMPAVLGRSAEYADPLPQALVLTAIVIGFAMTAFALVLALRGQGELDTDHVDGRGDRK